MHNELRTKMAPATLAAIAAFAALTFAAPAPAQAQTPAHSWTVERRGGQDFVKDHVGNAVPAKAYGRIVLASPGAVETLYLIGAEGAIAAIAASAGGTWPEERTAKLPSIGSPARPSLETIVSYAPDLVILSGMNTELAATLSSRGFMVLIHRAESIGDILNATLLMGTLTGHRSAAEALVAERRARLAEVAKELVAEPLGLKGAFVYSASPVMAFTEKSLPGEILATLGVRNIAAGLDGARPILSPELILASNPDFLFGAMSIAKPEDLLGADPSIARTRAGREKNVTIVPSSLFLRPSPRIVDGILELRDELVKVAAKK